MYECTVVDHNSRIQFTVWRGSALVCNSGEISLRHGEFEDTGHASGTCNDGAIFANITRHIGDHFTSQLVVNTSLDMNGKGIECAVDDGSSRIPVNASTITLTTGRCMLMGKKIQP